MTTGDYGPILQIIPVAQKKVQFDVDTKKEIFFDTRDSIKGDTSKFPIYEMPPNFDSTLVEGPS